MLSDACYMCLGKTKYTNPLHMAFALGKMYNTRAFRTEHEVTPYSSRTPRHRGKLVLGWDWPQENLNHLRGRTGLTPSPSKMRKQFCQRVGKDYSFSKRLKAGSGNPKAILQCFQQLPRTIPNPPPFSNQKGLSSDV